MEIKINRNGTEFGPYTVEEVNQYLADGKLLPTDLAWHEPTKTWVRLSQMVSSQNQSGQVAAQKEEDSAAGETRGGGRYRIIKQLGRGGMGVVFLATDTQLNEELALKSFPPEMAVDEAALDDMKREVQKSRKLSHPNIIRIHDFVNLPGEDPFLTMEFVEGQELADMRRDQPNGVFAWEDIKQYIIQLCDALTTAHNENTVHRDLKPTQMMIDKEGRLKLCDFGIAASMADSLSYSSMKHAVSGTLLFMSPQQMNGEVPRAGDDIYALGATLYDLMTGKPPFYTGNINVQVMNRPATPMKDRLEEFGIENDVPDYVDQLVLTCLQKEAENRPASAEEIKNWILTEGGTATLKTVRVAFKPPGFSKELVFDLSRKKLKIAGALGGVLAISLLGWLFFKPPPVYDIPEIQKRLSKNAIVNEGLNKPPSATYYKMHGKVQFENREGDRGIRLVNGADNTNYIEILNYRGKGLENIQVADYTLSAHFMPDSTPKDGKKDERQFAILMKQGFHVGLSYGHGQRFAMSHQYIEGGKTKLAAAVSAGKFEEKEWHHVVGTVNFEEGIVKLYVDGVEAGSDVFPKRSRGYTSSEPWRIGVASPMGKSHRWFANGAVDQVRIWKRSMNPQEIKELAVAEQPVQFERELLVYYTFDAGDNQLKNAKKSLPSKGSQGGFDLVESTKKEFKPEPCEDRFGEPNRAFFFDGITNSITSGRGGTRKYVLTSPNEPRTFSAWFKPEETDKGRQSIISFGSAKANAGWELLTDPKKGLIGSWSGGTNYLSGGELNAGQWHHAVFSYDDTMKLITLYLDGELLGSFTNQVATTSASSSIKIGGRPLAASTEIKPGKKKKIKPGKKKKGDEPAEKIVYDNFHGAIDDVRVYLRSLDEADVRELYDGEKPPTRGPWIYGLVFVVAVFGTPWVLCKMGCRIPAKLMDPILQRLPEKIAAPLVRFKQVKQEPVVAEASAP
jgi:serine/threonine protein kinase